MPEIPSSVTVEVPAEVVVDAAAKLIEASEFLLVLEAEGLSNEMGQAALDLLRAVLGKYNETDLLVVESHARALERLGARMDLPDFNEQADTIRRLKTVGIEAFSEAR